MRLVLVTVLLFATAGCVAAPMGAAPARRLPWAVERFGPMPPGAGETEWRAEGAKRLTGVRRVWREGHALVVDSAEGVQVRFVDAGDCGGFETCRRWEYLHSLRVPIAPFQVKRVPGEPAPHPEHPGNLLGFAGDEQAAVQFAVVALNHGEGVEHLVVSTFNGMTVNIGAPPTLSPGADWLAAGECSDMYGCEFSIWSVHAFTGLSLAIRAPDESGCCDVVGWTGPAALNVRIGEAPGEVHRTANGGWRLTAGTRSMDLEPPRPDLRR